MSKAQISDLNIHKCWRLNAHASLPTVVHTWTSPFSLLLMHYPLRRQKSISHNLTTSRGMKDLLASKFFLGVVKLWVLSYQKDIWILTRIMGFSDYLLVIPDDIFQMSPKMRIFTHCVTSVKNSYLHSFLASLVPSLKGHPVCERSVKFSTRWPALWSENRVALNPY